MSCSTITSVLPFGHRADQFHGAVGLAVAHAGGRLVEQDHLGAAGDRDADLKRALLGVGQQAGRQIAPLGKLEPFQQPLGRLVQRLLAAEQMPEGIAVAARPQQAASDVLEHASCAGRSR